MFIVAQSHRRNNRAAGLLLAAFAVVLPACDNTAQPEAGSETQTPAPEAASKSKGALAAPAGLPTEALAAWEQYANSECREMGDTFKAVRFLPAASLAPETELSPGDGTFLTGEFNGDGKPDFFVSTDNWGCGASGGYGKMGPPQDFIISSAGGYQADYAFNGYMAPDQVKRRGDRDVIELRGGWNGECGPVETIVWGWTGKAMEAIERRDDEGRAVDKEGCVATPKGKLPIKDGLWADDRAGGCAKMTSNDPAFIVADDQMVFVQDYRTLKPVKDLGANRFRTGSASNYDEQIIKVQSPARMKIEGEMGGSYTWCSPKTRWEPWEFDPAAE